MSWRVEVLTLINVETAVFQDVTPCTLVQCFSTTWPWPGTGLYLPILVRGLTKDENQWSSRRLPKLQRILLLLSATLEDEGNRSFETLVTFH
ncbi:hypothetical protein B7P43_G14680 [Cryptotermes secundus]|uniref:Uncharacterized protein n=1 Tax=Cryptotermes secundus TaxID=105785 RepID=A0A2J7R6Y3_9NEOP|nr:hypothetical protein B7P43_G14680 [Cryptotermes secundus]